MEDNKIYEKIEETYNSEKGKGFITHLLRSFLPINRSSKMIENDRNLKMVDCVTGEKLCSVNEHFALIMSKKGTDAMMENLRASAKAMVDEKEYEEPESVKQLRKKVKQVAVTCKGSDKVMSEQTLNQLFNFYATQMLMGNKHINWIANNERGKEFIDYAKKEGYVENKKEEKVVKKVAEKTKMTLGDLEVLQQLKEKMKNEK